MVPASELHALVHGCGAYQLNRALISLAGKDRVRWLNGMVSNNIRDLASGQGVYAFVLNPQGQIQGDLYAFNRGETLVLEIEAQQAATLLPLLRRYIIMDKVEVEDLTDKFTVFAIAGPKCNDVLGKLGITPGNGALAISEASWNGVALSVIRGDNPVSANYEFWVPKERAEAFWRALLESGAVDISEPALEAFRILSGIPKIGVDIRERTLPQETGQERALSFTKGCYIGQEIVERIRARGSVHRVLTGFEIDGPTPSPGAAIQVDGKDVGQITTVASIPVHDREQVVALGYLRKEHRESVLQSGASKVKPVALPFSILLQQV